MAYERNTGEFDSLARHTLELYQQGRYREALEIAKDSAKRFPDKAVDTSYWKACLHSRLGEHEKALEALQDALARGIWWSKEMLLDEEDLAPLRDMGGFREILDQCDTLRQRAEANSKPRLLVYGPDTSSTGLLVVLHGRGSTAEAVLQHWKSPTLKLGLTLAIPQSTQMVAKDLFCWDDTHRAENEIHEAYAQVAKSHEINIDRTIIAGFSQGATLAIYMGLKRSVPGRGFIAINPGYRAAETLNEIVGGKTGLKGCMMLGAKDPHFSQNKQLHNLLVQSGVRCELTIEENLSHEYPKDFDAKLKSAAQFILS